MNINDLSILKNFDEIKKFLEESADNDEISAKYIRQYLTQNVSTIEKHFPVVVILNDNPDMLLEFDFKGCDFFCDSWRGSYNYPAARYSDAVYDVETVIDNLKKMSNKTVSGYKGGEYVLDEEDCVYLVTVFSSAGNSTTAVNITVINDVVYIATKNNMY